MQNLGTGPGFQKQQPGAQNSLVIDTMVNEKSSIFGGDKCVDDMWRHIVKSYKYPPSFADLFDQAAVATEYAQWNLQRDISNGLCGRQSRRHIVVGADNGCSDRNGRRNRQSGSEYKPP